MTAGANSTTRLANMQKKNVDVGQMQCDQSEKCIGT